MGLTPLLKVLAQCKLMVAGSHLVGGARPEPSVDDLLQQPIELVIGPEEAGRDVVQKVEHVEERDHLFTRGSEMRPRAIERR